MENLYKLTKVAIDSLKNNLFFMINLFFDIISENDFKRVCIDLKLLESVINDEDNIDD